MSTIAEFYSRNLSTEVVKGMIQKATTGGTPGRAPLGYRNVRQFDKLGREMRTVIVDPERADLMRWAFQAFATGDWTLVSMAAELNARGLRTLPSPKRPGRAITDSLLHDLLRNPYFKGDVDWRGAVYAGKHEPLVDPVTWERVRNVLASHRVGEKRHTHPHYLKSTVFCGQCGSRFVVNMTTTRRGATYPYFMCLGRHQKRTSCTQKALYIPPLKSAWPSSTRGSSWQAAQPKPMPPVSNSVLSGSD